MLPLFPPPAVYIYKNMYVYVREIKSQKVVILNSKTSLKKVGREEEKKS